jgi:3-hydroxyisobutyrate dehydrogenase-like beta-hydroxyacid dehydrogenase
VTTVALGEAVALGETFGLDRTMLLDVLADSAVGPTVRSKRANIESGTYPPTFKLNLALKDLRLATQAPAGSGPDLRVAAAARSWLEQAAESGAGDLDFSAVVETILTAVPTLSDPNGRHLASARD